MPYYSCLFQSTNVYAIMSESGVGLGHEWKPTTIDEIVHWPGVATCHGSLDGRPHTTHARWRPNDPHFDPVIADSISKSQWVMIKKYFKLNNNLAEPKRGMPNYNPYSKHDYTYTVLLHNMNYVTRRADMDGTINESTWGFGGYLGECGGRLMGKRYQKEDRLPF
jgi:hypothetical protein